MVTTAGAWQPRRWDHLKSWPKPNERSEARDNQSTSKTVAEDHFPGNCPYIPDLPLTCKRPDYDEDSARSVLHLCKRRNTSRRLSAGDNIIVVEATKLLCSADQDQEEIHAIYVVDADQRLVGVASLRSMLLASPDILMGRIADRKDIVSLAYLLWCRCLCLQLGDLT